MIIAVRREPADAGIRKPAMDPLRAVPRIGAVGEERIGPPGPGDAIGPGAFPGLDAVEPREERAAEHWEPAVGTRHADEIINEVRVVHGGPLHPRQTSGVHRG